MEGFGQAGLDTGENTNGTSESRRNRNLKRLSALLSASALGVFLEGCGAGASGGAGSANGEAAPNTESQPPVLTSDDAPVLELVANEQLVNEQVEEEPTEKTLAEEVAVEEETTEETPAEETPAEETPAEETPAEETPAEETPAEETPAEEEETVDDNSPDNADDGANSRHLVGTEETDILYAYDLLDSVAGGRGKDALIGGEGADNLEGGHENDILVGRGGDDRLVGGHGSDYLYGEEGNDRIYGGTGFDTLGGGDGNDHIYGGAHRDILFGQEGYDYLEGGAGKDEYHFFTAEGDTDTIVDDGGLLVFTGEAYEGVSADDFAYRQSGNDLRITVSTEGVRQTIVVRDYFANSDAYSLLLRNAEGEQTLRVDNIVVPNVIYGGDGNDHIHYNIRLARGLGGHGGHDDYDRPNQGSGPEDIYGLSGGDHLYGKGGDDHLYGGEDTDWLYGGEGDDLLYGGEDGGDDRLYGEAGEDRLYSGAGDDFLIGGTGRDELYGGAGKDILRGGAGADIIDGGGNGEDVLVGDVADYRYSEKGVRVNLLLQGQEQRDFEANDYGFVANNNEALGDVLTNIEGILGSKANNGHDWLTGDANDNRIYGYQGNDRLEGGAGNDFLYGGQGNDKLYGGQGDDIYHFARDSGADIVNDIQGNNRIQFNPESLNYHVSIENYSSSDFDADNFARSGNDLIITNNHPGDSYAQQQVTLVDYFGNEDAYTIEFCVRPNPVIHGVHSQDKFIEVSALDIAGWV